MVSVYSFSWFSFGRVGTFCTPLNVFWERAQKSPRWPVRLESDLFCFPHHKISTHSPLQEHLTEVFQLSTSECILLAAIHTNHIHNGNKVNFCSEFETISGFIAPHIAHSCLCFSEFLSLVHTSATASQAFTYGSSRDTI